MPPVALTCGWCYSKVRAVAGSFSTMSIRSLDPTGVIPSEVEGPVEVAVKSNCGFNPISLAPNITLAAAGSGP